MKVTIALEASEALYAVHDIGRAQAKAREHLAYLRATDADGDTIEAVEYAIDKRQDAIDKLDAAMRPDRPRGRIVGARTLREIAADLTAEALRC